MSFWQPLYELFYRETQPLTRTSLPTWTHASVRIDAPNLQRHVARQPYASSRLHLDFPNVDRQENSFALQACLPRAPTTHISKTQTGQPTRVPAQRTRCAQGVRMMCVCRAGSACLPAQLEQLQCSRRWPPSRNDAACTRQQAGWCGYVQRQDVTADGNGCLVSRPVAGMPAVLVKGRQALCLPLACLPAPPPVQHERGGAA